MKQMLSETITVRRRIMIKSLVKNPYPTYEKFLKSIRKDSIKKLSTNEELTSLINKYLSQQSEHSNTCNRTDSISKQFDVALSKIIEKEETFEEEVEKNQMKVITKEITPEEESIIKSILKTNFLFNDIGEDVFQFILKEMVQINIDKDQYLFQQGFELKSLFILSKGKLALINSNNKIIQYYNQWDSFGHCSLFSNVFLSKINCSVKALDKSEIYVVDSGTFLYIRNNIINYYLEQKFFFIKKIFFLDFLDSIKKFELCNKVEIAEYERFDLLNKKNMIFAKEGTMVLMNGNKQVLKLSQGDMLRVKETLFGKDYEEEIEYNKAQVLVSNNIAINPNSTYTNKLITYELSKSSIQSVLGKDFQNKVLFSVFNHFVSTNCFFNFIFSCKLRPEIFSKFRLVKYSDDDHVYSKLSNNQRVILLLEGNLKDQNTHEYIASKGDFIGEKIIKGNIELDKKYITQNCLTLECDVWSLSKFLGYDLFDNQTRKKKMLGQMLKKIKIFRYLTDSLLNEVCLKLEKRKFKPIEDISDLACTTNNTAVSPKKSGEKEFMTIVTKGKIKVSNENGAIIKESEAICSFGESEIFCDKYQDKEKYTYSAIDKTTCYVLSKKSFDSLFTNSLLTNYMKNISYSNSSFSLKDFYFIKTLGKSTFGNVNLVRDSQRFFCLKTITRSFADKDKFSLTLPTQRKILLNIDHPFVIKTYGTLKNESFCYIVMEFVNGITIEDYLSQRKDYHKDIYQIIRFYTAIIFSILEYFKSQFIIHRSISPKAFVIDESGYLKLVYLSTAKIIRDYTLTVIGNPMYSAPEMILGKGYSTSCDYWSTGILLFIMYYNKFPYKTLIWNDPMKLFNLVVSKNISYPNYDHYEEKEESDDNLDNYNNEEAENIECYNKVSVEEHQKVYELLTGLLTKDVNKRICSIEQLQKIKMFKDFDFKKLLEFEVKPPYVPEVKKYDFKEIESKGGIKYTDYEAGTRKLYDDASKNIEETTIYNTNWADEF